MREGRGKRKQKRIKEKKIETKPKSLGRDGERGEKSNRRAKRRINEMNRLNRQQKEQIGALNDQEILDSKRFGELENQYKNSMAGLGDVSAINDQLSKSLEELKISNQADRRAFANQQTANQELITNLQDSNASQIATLEARAADDRELYKSQLSGLEDMYSGQKELIAEQKRLQQIQARKAKNLRNAYVPGREDSLASVRYGDNRKKKRQAKDNRLSDLRINTGLQTGASSASAAVAGLQLA